MSRKARRALAHTTAPVALAAPVAVVQQTQTGQPPRGSISRQRDLYALANKSLQAVTPARISAALRDLEWGRLEQWSDLITQAKRDPTVRRAYGIRRNAVAGRKYTCKAPPDIDPRYQREAERLAKLTADWLAGIDGRETFLMRVLDAIGMGVSVHELVWERRAGAWLPTPVQILTRELRWERDWTLSFRNADSVWINTVTPSKNDPAYCRDDTPEQRRARFLIHIPWTEQGRPQDQGEFQAAVYYWAFKVNAFAMWLIGAEHFGNPLLVVQAGDNASESQCAELLTDAQRITTDSVAVLKGATTLTVHDPKASGSTPIWSTLVDATDMQITTAIGVAPDLLKSGPNGSRASDTVKDGIRVEGSELDATLMWGSIVRDAVREIARLNRFDPAVPMPLVESVFDNAVAVSVDVAATGRVTYDQMLAGNGLPPLKTGGDQVLRAGCGRSGAVLGRARCAIDAVRTRHARARECARGLPFPSLDTLGGWDAVAADEHPDFADVLSLADEPAQVRARATIGRPYELAARTTIAAVSEFGRVREAIAAAAPGGPDAVRAAVESFRGDGALEALTYEPMVLADLAGQMFVRLVELPEDGTRHLAQPDMRPAFLRLPFAEAVAFWTERGGDPALLDEVLGAYRLRAAQYTDGQLDAVSETAIAEITRTLESGGTLADFKAAVEADTAALGISPAHPGYLETVYRTQVASAYGAGRYAQLQSPEVIAARPYRQYRTAQDSRVRAEHAVMDGVTWRADDPAFAAIATPCNFNCRCALVSYSQADVDDEGIVIATSVPSGFVMGAGFGAQSFVR